MPLSPSSSPLAFRVGPVRNMPYLPALDGLRAIAVLAVIAYHLEAAWLPGGYLGVEVFFTISGYLITALLITEYERTDAISFRGFWMRRATRLLPALGLLLLGVVVLAATTAPDALPSLRGQALAASTYVTNWSLILTEQSYFESFGRPPLLQHLWSLAIEEQFYLLMPVLFLAGRRLLGRHVTLGLVLVGIVASTWAMWSGFDPLADPSRLYYGTDTRAAGILVGVALAMVWRPWHGASNGLEAYRTTPWPDLIGLGGLVFVISQVWVLDAYQPRLYQGGFLLVALATAAVLAAIVMPGSILAVPLSVKPLRWIGVRSYGLYLWHWPVFMVLRPGVDTVMGEPWLTLLRLGATVALAELSYTFVERPIREGRFRAQVIGFLRAAPDATSLRRGTLIAGFSALAVFAVGSVQLPNRAAAVAAPLDLVALATGEGLDPAAATSALGLDLDPTGAGEAGADGSTDTPGGTADRPADRPGDADDLMAGPWMEATRHAIPKTVDPTVAAVDAEGQPTQAAVAPTWARVLVFGDSVMVGAAEAVGAIEGAVVDAQIGRQWHELVELVDLDLTADDAVVIHLGNNGAPTTATIDEVLDHFSDAGRVVLVNVRVPRPWESQVNRALAGATGRWDNTVLADWHGAADGAPEYFAGDGVHLNARGAQALTGTIGYALDVPR